MTVGSTGLRLPCSGGIENQYRRCGGSGTRALAFSELSKLCFLSE